MQILEKISKRYSEWRESTDIYQVARGPWPGWRRSYLLLAVSFALLALLPWIWIEDPAPQTASSEQILSQGRVGRAVLPGTTLFLDPTAPQLSTEQIAERDVALRPLRPPRLDFSRAPLRGELARFGNRVWLSGEINRLARAELRLGGVSPRRLDRQMQEAVLQRQVESAWLRAEAELQGVSVPETENFLSRGDKRELLRAGFTRTDIEERLRALLLASVLREIGQARGERDLEAQWVQRWSKQTECGLPLCE